MGELKKADVYPPTVWSRLREGLLVDLILAGLAVVVAGLTFDYRQMVLGGLIGAGGAVALIVPVLFLEYRADQAWERSEQEVRNDASDR